MAAKDAEDSTTLGLYRKMLLWNYGAWGTEDEGPLPELKKVPTSFANAQEYIDTFAPLILEESGALLTRGTEELESSKSHRAVTGPAHQKDGFLIVQVLVEPGVAQNFHSSDMIWVTKDDPNSEQMRKQLNALGVMETLEGEQSIRIRFYLQDDDLKTKPDASEKQRRQAMSSGLKQLNNGFYITRLANLMTIVREWNALHSIEKVNFKEVLFSPGGRVAPELAVMKAPQLMEEAMSKEYNDSQMKALTGGLGGQQVVLIQGPPGTGKTKTLLGLLSIVLHAAPEGSLNLKTFPEQKEKPTQEEKERLWLKSSPWLAGHENARDEVKPWETGSIEDIFGMLGVAKPLAISKDASPKAHVLVCAPSNSALDEIVIRLMSSGVIDRKGQRYSPNIVRIGLQVHHSVQSVALDTLVDQRLARLVSAKGKVNPTKRERERLKLAVIEDAHIVCSTLSFSGSGLLSRLSRAFDVVVIDEAAQAVEPSTLIPLCTGAQQVFLIGDPVQLPATVISKRAVAYNYDVSMFKRLQSAGYPVHVLDTQYRMHPLISAFPSNEFYFGKLKNGPDVAEVTARPWHAHKCLGPFSVYDVRGSEAIPESSSSLENRSEAEMVFSVYLALVTRFPELRNSANVAVISPYKAQVKLLKQKFREALGDAARMVDINTIDGFQGREKEVAIFSAVRSSKQGRIGFVADERRINVGLTRARCSLLVIGNAAALGSDLRWHNLLRYARMQRAFFVAKKPYSEYLGQVIAGDILPEGPTAQDLREMAAEEPQAEAHVFADEDDYSDGEDPAPARKTPIKLDAKKHVKPPGSTLNPPAKKPRKSST